MDTISESVEYREVPGYPAYRVGNDGSVWSHLVQGAWGRWGGSDRYSSSWKRLRPWSNRGYLYVSLHRQTKKWNVKVHQLVLLAFVGPPPPGTESLHANNVKTDNRLANLSWGTHKRNMANNIRLSDAEMDELRDLRANGMPYKELMARFHISRRYVWRVIRGDHSA